jgi:hypothetical protein
MDRQVIGGLDFLPGDEAGKIERGWEMAHDWVPLTTKSKISKLRGSPAALAA